MARTQINALLDDLWATYRELVEAASGLSNEQLDTQVPAYGGRQTPLRNSIYQAIYHPLEHTVHVTKVLQETGAGGAQPTESQLILGEAMKALGTFTGVFARMTDDDLDRSFEDQTPRGVAEHVRGGVQRLAARVGDVRDGKVVAG